MIETAKANNLNPEKYLAYLLSILPDLCARDNNPAVDDLAGSGPKGVRRGVLDY